jgi:hypothetical protein
VVMLRPLTSGGFPAAAPRSKVSPAMRIPAVLRQPGLQDAGLAALLLLGSWAGNDAVATGMLGASSGAGGRLREPVVRWALIGVCVAAVALRRRWPVPALAAASLAAVAQMALAETPVPADLAVPLTLRHRCPPTWPCRSPSTRSRSTGGGPCRSGCSAPPWPW